eukprot:6206891-Pleurochrysis_carterae.AAC.2
MRIYSICNLRGISERLNVTRYWPFGPPARTACSGRQRSRARQPSRSGSERVDGQRLGGKESWNHG